MALKEKFKDRLKILYAKDNDFYKLGIKDDTFNRYIRGDRFPKPEILEQIKEHYNVPYSYLFGEYDNIDLNTSEISGILGLSNKSIKKLKKITQGNKIDKELMLFALNQLIENLDFLELGKLLLIPNEDNKYIKSDNIYEYYSFYIHHGQGIGSYDYDIRVINEKKDYNSFMLNKRLFELFEQIRHSKECAEVFMDYVDDERKQIEETEELIREHILLKDNEPFELDEKTEKLINENNKQEEIRNQQIIDKRKKDLGI